MTERSRVWDGTATGDATEAPYDAPTEFARLFQRGFGIGQMTNLGGVINGAPGFSDLTPSSPVANTVRIASGIAWVYGTQYDNDANVDVNIPTPGVSTRVDRVVLRKSWAAQTVRITRIAGVEGAGAPALVQIAGTTWDIPLAQASITTGGAITLTDQREFPGTPPIPAGTLTMFAGAAAPTGWQLCDGSAISRSTFASLFAVIGTSYGAGNGTTTFNVPDLRSRGPIGAGTGSGLTNRVLASSGGEENHVLGAAEMPTHTHTQDAHNHGVTDPTHAHDGHFNFYTAPAAGATAIAVQTGGSQLAETFAASTGVTVNNATATNQNAGSGGGHNNMQPWLAVNFIIKT